MQNPFESGQIKSYLLLYASVVVIMVLFFVASSLFNEVEVSEKKVFKNVMQEERAVESLQTRAPREEKGLAGQGK